MTTLRAFQHEIDEIQAREISKQRLAAHTTVDTQLGKENKPTKHISKGSADLKVAEDHPVKAELAKGLNGGKVEDGKEEHDEAEESEEEFLIQVRYAFAFYLRPVLTSAVMSDPLTLPSISER
jgi:hypothetical protein